MAIDVRLRCEADLAACERIARVVHTTDGYPTYMPDDDFVGFLSSAYALDAWVAITDSRIVGHVALHRSASDAVIALAATRLGVAPAQLGVVARLLVAPTVRRHGVGSALLHAAASDASCRGLVPILDVVTSYESAVALYERAGWTKLGTIAFPLPDGGEIEEFLFCAPGVIPASRAQMGYD